MNQRLGLFSLTLALLAACGPGDTASTNSDDWKLNDSRNDMGGDMPAGLDEGSPDMNVTLPDMPGVTMMCGNGVLDEGERCDGDCPTQLDDCELPPSDACTTLSYEGAAASCDAQCVYAQKSACVSEDGCCPMGCDATSDSDCAGAVCGNGVREQGELCDGDCYDDVAECPEPPLPDLCSKVVLSGSADQCDVTCTVEPITELDDFDGCCPEGATPQLDSDCIPAQMCGDGVVDPGETCDGNCPQSVAECDDLNACTTDVISGMASMCSVQCGGVPITSCISGDGCCAPGCAGQDTDCDEVDLCNVPVPTSLTYGPASVIDELALGNGTVGFDFTGDGQINNSLGSTLDQLGPIIGASLSDFNQAIAQQISAGQLAMVLEHEQLTGLIGPATFSINLLTAAPQCFTAPDAAGTNFYRIASSSYTSQGAPISVFSPATIDVQRDVRADTTSVVTLPVNLLGLSIDIKFEATRIEARVVPARSALPDRGVALDDGVLGGYTRLTSLYDEINDAIANDCPCVSSPPNVQLIEYTSAQGNDASCRSDFNASQCSGAQGGCAAFIDNCGTLVQFLPLFTDVDSTSPVSNCEDTSTCDSMSLGFTFTTAGARILGLDAP